MSNWERVELAAFVVLAAIPALAVLAAFIATLRGLFTMPVLGAVPVPEQRRWPSVSMIVPACDEEESVAAALRSTLAQAYPDLQVVAVDDRSHDRTGAILDDLAAEDSRLSVVHVTELPDGWLGKLNALARGVRESRGEWLVFADADAHLGPATLKKAISYAEDTRTDFISVMPEIAPSGFWGDSVFNVVTAFFCLGARPWSIRDSKTKALGATGAFMLVRRAAFDRTPGFEWLKLEVADDFGLCLMIKSFGGRCDLLNGRGEVRLTWYSSLREMTLKMQKNFYAIVGRFSLGRILAQAAFLAWIGVAPIAALAAFHAPWQIALVAAAEVLLVSNAVVASAWTARPILPAIAAPLGFLLLAFMLVRAGVIGHRQGGITWRGVLYPTDLLREHQRVRM